MKALDLLEHFMFRLCLYLAVMILVLVGANWAQDQRIIPSADVPTEYYT